MFGLQYQLDSATMLETNYVGNHGVKLLFGGGARLNFVPFEGTGFYRNTCVRRCSASGNALLERVPNPFFGVVGTGPLAGPTVPLGQLLRPYPQYDQVIAVQAPAGMSNYNAFTLAANRRLSRGLQFQISFTASKYLTNTEGPEGAVSQNPQAGRMRNYYDISPEKSVMNNDIPRSLVASYIYELPVGSGPQVPIRRSCQRGGSGRLAGCRDQHLQVGLPTLCGRHQQQLELARRIPASGRPQKPDFG